MVVGFEAKRLFRNFTGLGNYGRFIVSALSEYYPEDKFLLYTPFTSDHPDVKPLLTKKNIEVIASSPLYRKLHLTSLWRSWLVKNEPTISTINVFHGLSGELPVGLPSDIKQVVTIHDLIFLRYPQFYKSLDVAIYKAKALSACNRADRIIAISDQTKNDIHEFLRIPENKISVVYQGCHHNFLRRAAADELVDIKKKYGLPDRYLLNVGTVEPRKNIEIIIEAMHGQGSSVRIPLVVVGKVTPYKEKLVSLIRKYKLERDVHFLHDTPFPDFPAIYQGATAFVYASVFEGFGIPLLEAIMSRVPVIAPNGSCFREAAGPASVYYNLDRVDELTASISDLVNNREKAEHMIVNSLAFARQFEPATIAHNVRELYNSL